MVPRVPFKMANRAAGAALPNCLQPFNDPSSEATWRSGYAAVCKTVYPGSIPGVAST
jgi:hypothetical protein